VGADGLKVNVGASARSFKPPKAGGGGVEPSESDMVAEEIHNLRFTQHTWCVTSRFRSKRARNVWQQLADGTKILDFVKVHALHWPTAPTNNTAHSAVA